MVWTGFLARQGTLNIRPLVSLGQLGDHVMALGLLFYIPWGLRVVVIFCLSELLGFTHCPLCLYLGVLRLLLHSLFFPKSSLDGLSLWLESLLMQIISCFKIFLVFQPEKLQLGVLRS